MPMDWPNERWIKLYTRRTAEDLALSWRARALWKEVLVECDRAGVIRMREGRERARLLARMLRMPPGFVGRALPELLQDGRVVEASMGFVGPNFVEAQEATTSEAERQRRHREKLRDLALAGAVTKRDRRSHSVTKPSRGVTTRQDKVVVVDQDALRSKGSAPSVAPAQSDSSQQQPIQPRGGAGEIRAGVKRKPDGSLEFDARIPTACWEFMQAIRVEEYGLTKETMPRKHKEFSTGFLEWHHEKVIALPDPTAQVASGYRLYLEDEDFAEGGWPTNKFMCSGICDTRLSARRPRRRASGFL